MRYYIIAGEASGDLHASNLVFELKKLDDQAEFRGWGGDLMEKQGVTLVKHYRDMAYMGLIEVLANLPAILKNIRSCKSDLRRYDPDVLILVDFPGFNLRIADFASRSGIKVFYYISPKIWAWNQKRALKIKRVVDRMFCILPFEVDFYRKWGIKKADYVGNPIMDAIDRYSFKDSTGGQPVIALLPGSRKQEVEKVLPLMLEAAGHFKEYRAVIAGAPSFSEDMYKQYVKGRNVEVVFNGTYDLLKNARAALVTSGTATLETALLNVPQVVLYKANPFTVALARKLIRVNYISLVNLIAGKEVVKELIQQDCTPERIRTELSRLLYNTDYRKTMLDHYRDLQEQVGPAGASERAAVKMMNYLRG